MCGFKRLTSEDVRDYLLLVADDEPYTKDEMILAFKYGDIATLPERAVQHLSVNLGLRFYQIKSSLEGEVVDETEMAKEVIKELGRDAYVARLKEILVPLLLRLAQHVTYAYISVDDNSKRLEQTMLIRMWREVIQDFERVMVHYGIEYDDSAEYVDGTFDVAKEFSRECLKHFPIDKKEEYIKRWAGKGLHLVRVDV